MSLPLEAATRVGFITGTRDQQEAREIATRAEALGYDSLWTGDHIAFTLPVLDPLLQLAQMATASERLLLGTSVFLLPLRHPVLAAKQATSVAVLTGNRFGFGVGLSPWPDDFRVLNVPWKGRGKRLDEAIEIIRGLETGEFFEFHGEHFDLEPIKLCPAPTERIPILIGGHADAALRRAARVGDGWMHAGGGEAQDFDAAMVRIAELRKEYGREKEPFEVHVISMDAYTPDGIRKLEDKGVTDCIVGFRNGYAEDTMPLEKKLDAIRGYADNVIAKVG